MKYGRYGGGFVDFDKVYIGCTNARKKGTRNNKVTMRRADLEAAMGSIHLLLKLHTNCSRSSPASPQP